MNPYLTIFLLTAFVLAVFKLISNKIRSGKFIHINAKKATYAAVFIAYTGIVVIIAYLAFTEWIR